MRIGLDARFLTHPQRGGFKTYTENLVHALSVIDDINQYVLYLDRHPGEAMLPQRDNFSYRVVECKVPGIGMPVREQMSLRLSIAQDNLDIVHFLCNTAPVGISNKFIVTLHDTIQLINPQIFSYSMGLAAFKRWAISAYSRWAIFRTAQSANRVITVSMYEKTEIGKHVGVKMERICVTHLAPNPLFSPTSQAQKASWRSTLQQKFGIHKPFLLGVGYEPRKNIPLLIEAFARLVPDYPDLSLVIVAAEEQSRLFFEQLAREKNIVERVIIIGAIPSEELAILYNLAEVFVFPSERESFGLPPLEALACGTPVIAMSMTSLPEILQNSALLVEGKNAQAWANTIVKVITDANLRDYLVNRGLQRAANFSWEQCARETLQVYETALTESQPRVIH